MITLNTATLRALRFCLLLMFTSAASAADSLSTESANVLAEAQNSPFVELININTATVEQLETLEKIGPAKAKAIVEWRESNGPFTSFEQLLAVRGIGPKILALNQSLIRL